MTVDKPTDTNSREITDVITDWMAESGNGEIGLMDLVFFDQLILQNRQHKTVRR